MNIDRRDDRVSRLGIAVIAAVLFGASAPAFAAPARQDMIVTDFDAVRLNAPVEVVLTTSPHGASAVATGEREALDALDLQVSARTLTIRMRDVTVLGGSGGRPRAPTRILLTTAELRRIAVLGAGSLSADRLKGARVDASVQGSGRLSVGHVDADRADASLTGSGTLMLAGTVLDLSVLASGSGRVDASGLDTRRAVIAAEGSVDAQFQARERAQLTVNGTGRLVVTGKPQCVVRRTGSATVQCAGQDF